MTDIKKPPNAFIGKPLGAVEHLKLIREERGITEAQLDQLGISLVPTQDTKDEVGWSELGPLIRIPYWGTTGEKLLDNRGNQMVRYRRTVLNAKGERYTQRKGTGSRHYLPRLPSLDWNSIAKDPSVDLFYTEGEFKSISSSINLGPTIGNAGVTSWRGPDGGLARPLDEFTWKGRRVYIVYDAESTCTPSVPLKANIQKALGELAVDLRVRGAEVLSLLIAKTVSFVEGTKLGVDDYFAKGGTRQALLDTAVEPQVDEDWQFMFDNYAIFTGPKPHVFDFNKGVPYSSKDFRELIVTKTRVVDGKPMKIADIYREHDQRKWFDEYVFDPALEPGYLEESHKYNHWRGYATEPRQSADYEANIAEYIKFQTGVWGEKNLDYFFDWVAHIFQKPEERTMISPMLVSKVKGIGKSLTGEILRKIMGSHAAFNGTIDGSTGRFNGEVESKILMVLDEADALFEGKEGKLKWLTSDELRIEHKGREPYQIKSYLRTMFFTNENAPIRIAEDERRYWVVRSPRTEEDGLDDSPWSLYVRGVAEHLKSPEVLADIMWFFMQRDISLWDAFEPVPKTPDMMDMVEAGRTKKNVLTHLVYESLKDKGLWAVNSTMTANDNKTWLDIKALCRNQKGQIASHAYREDGKTKYASICMLPGHMLEVVDAGKKGTLLAPGQLTSEEVGKLLLATNTIYLTASGQMGIEKF